MPSASQCQTSTIAPSSAVQPPLLISETLKISWSGMPSFTEPSVGSDRMSERLSFSSTKYGPSVSAGRTIQAGAVAVFDVDAACVGALDATCVATLVGCAALDWIATQPASNAAPVAPNSVSS